MEGEQGLLLRRTWGAGKRERGGAGGGTWNVVTLLQLVEVATGTTAFLQLS